MCLRVGYLLPLQAKQLPNRCSNFPTSGKGFLSICVSGNAGAAKLLACEGVLRLEVPGCRGWLSSLLSRFALRQA